MLIAAGLAVLTLSAADSSVEWKLYRAAIAAADGAIRLNESSSAKRWLAEAPLAHRGWEWHYLNAQADHSDLECAVHSGPITGIAVSQDGRLFATTSGDKTVQIRDARTCSTVASFDGGSGATWSPSFRPGSVDTVAAMGSDGSLRVWSVEQKRELRRFEKLGNGLGAVAWSPDGKLLVTGSWTFERGKGVIGWVHLWNYDSGELVWKAEYGVKPIPAIAFRPDGQQFAVGTWDSIAGFFPVAGGGKPSAEVTIQLEGAYSAIQSVTYASGGGTLAVAAKDGMLRYYDSKTAKLVRESAGHTRWANAVAYAPGSSTWAVSGSSDETLRLWDTSSGALRRVLRGHTASVNAVTVSPDGHRIYSAAADGTVRIWNTRLADTSRDIWSTAKDVYGFAFSADGQRAASASSGGVVRLWEASSGRAIWEKPVHKSSANAVAFSPDGKRMVTGGNDGKLQLLDVATGGLIATWEEIADGRAAGIAWSQDGKYVFSPSSRPSGKIWDAVSGKLLHAVTGGKGEIYDAAFSPDSASLALGWTGGEAKVVDPATGRDLVTLPASPGGVQAVAFHPSGRLLATGGGDRKIRLWQMPSGQLLRTLEGHSELIYDVNFAPDGQRLVSASIDQTVRLWSTQTGEPVLSIPYLAQVYAAMFSKDGRRLATAPMNGTIQILDSKPVRDQ